MYPAIKIENVTVALLAEVIQSRRSFNSQHRSDSVVRQEFSAEKSLTDAFGYDNIYCEMTKLGEKDLKLQRQLVCNGDSHGKITRFIDVVHDLTLPRRTWVDFDTYRLGRVESIAPDEIEYFSDSTMHTIDSEVLTKAHFSGYTKQFIIDDLNDEIAL